MNIILSSKSTIPIYEQIVEQIQTAIIDGLLMPGEALPSLRSLAKDLKVSVITTKRAYEELERAGMIVTMSGKGSFVASFNQEMLFEKRRFLLEEKIEEVVETSKKLCIDEEELISIIRLYYNGDDEVE